MSPSIANLRRPPLLIRAARRAASEYRRERHLPGLLGGDAAEGRVLARLQADEAELDAQRRDGLSGYAPGRHVGILGALIAEAAACQTKASGSASLRAVANA